MRWEGLRDSPGPASSLIRAPIICRLSVRCAMRQARVGLASSRAGAAWCAWCAWWEEDETRLSASCEHVRRPAPRGRVGRGGRGRIQRFRSARAAERGRGRHAPRGAELQTRFPELIPQAAVHPTPHCDAAGTAHARKGRHSFVTLPQNRRSEYGMPLAWPLVHYIQYCALGSALLLMPGDEHVGRVVTTCSQHANTHPVAQLTHT